MQIFARITKVDEATGKVYGRAVQEVPDRSSEIFDYESSKPNFVKWSEGFAKITDGKSVGNVRAMHNKIAAGKLTEITFADAEKAIDVCAEIVDPVEREKCFKGVYTGFSIGGRYVGDKWADPVHKGVQRYTAEPTEISLVDLPCVPTAQFTVVKADGSEELRKFETTTEPDALKKWYAEQPADVREALALMNSGGAVVAKIAERKDTKPEEGEHKYGDVKFADEKNKKYPIDTEEHIRAAWNYINKPKNAGKYDSADVSSIKSKIVAAWKDKIDAKGPPSAEKFALGELVKRADVQALAKAAAPLIGLELQLEKGLCTVAQLASIIDCLSCMADGVDYEADAEGDDSKLPEQFRAALKPLAEAFLAMASEETREAIGGDVNDDSSVELAAAGDLAKAGRKHTKAQRAHRDAIREHAKGINEHLDAMAEDDPAKDDDEDDGAEKLAKASDDLQKAVAERDAAKEALTKLKAEHEELLKKAAPPKGVARAVEKTLATDALANEPDDQPVRKADGTVDVDATLMKSMKAAYTKPSVVPFR